MNPQSHESTTRSPSTSTPTQIRADEALHVVGQYFRLADAGAPEVMDLFSDDVEIYFPVFGKRTGKRAFTDFVEGFFEKISSITHNIDDFEYVVAGDKVVVEGTTYGTAVDGTAWAGGHTPGGRFCSVFVIDNGHITHMSIYTDPDYTSNAIHGYGWDSNPEGEW